MDLAKIDGGEKVLFKGKDKLDFAPQFDELQRPFVQALLRAEQAAGKSAGVRLLWWLDIPCGATMSLTPRFTPCSASNMGAPTTGVRVSRRRTVCRNSSPSSRRRTGAERRSTLFTRATSSRGLNGFVR